MVMYKQSVYGTWFCTSLVSALGCSTLTEVVINHQSIIVVGVQEVWVMETSLKDRYTSVRNEKDFYSFRHR